MKTEKEKLQKKLNNINARKRDYVKKHSIHNLKSEYIGCKECGSKLKLSLVSGEVCPLCSNDLRNKSVLEKIKDYNFQILDIQEEMVFCDEPELRKGRKTTFTLYRRERDKYDDTLKKILSYLEELYNNEFMIAQCAKNDDYILVVSKDYNHAKTYFSAWYDCMIFDKNGELVLRRGSFIKAYSYSDFHVDLVDFADGKFRVFVRNHITSYSKCDDEYLAIWTINTDYKTFLHLQHNPFIFKDRRAESYHSIYDDHFTVNDGEHFMFEDLKGYTPYEVSLSKELRDELSKKK